MYNSWVNIVTVQIKDLRNVEESFFEIDGEEGTGGLNLLLIKSSECCGPRVRIV